MAAWKPPGLFDRDDAHAPPHAPARAALLPELTPQLFHTFNHRPLSFSFLVSQIVHLSTELIRLSG